MIRGFLRTVRYGRGWTGGTDTRAVETSFLRDGEPVAATLVLPARAAGPLPGWVALGGISKMGRFHPQLVRFAGALAGSGAAVLLPEVPEWKALDVDPRVAGPTVEGAIRAMGKRPEVREGKLGLIGFSFGGPQVAIAASRPEVSRHVAGIVLFGAYCCLERTVMCQLTGRHEWEGLAHELEPDPYGRWVVGSNHLTDVVGLEDAEDVAHALHTLAAEASGRRISAWMPDHDPLIARLRKGLAPSRRELYDLFARPTTAPPPDVAACRAIARRLAAACRRVEPLLEPGPALAEVDVPTRLIHGRGDRLIPFTEAMRLMEELPDAFARDVTVTGLFNHTAGRRPASLRDRVREGALLFEALRGLINTV